MFTIAKTGPNQDQPRLQCNRVLDPAQFRSIAQALGVVPFKARKFARVAASKATRAEVVDSLWNGKETSNTAQPSDWIVTTLTASGEALRDAAGNLNRYVVAARTFPALYAESGGSSEHGGLYAAKTTIEAIKLAGGFDIVAPWGQRMSAPSGYLLLNGEEVYGNNAETFEATYTVVG
jgi:hypothetical protein